MKRSILRALALCLTTTFVAGYAYAQDDKSSSTSPSTYNSAANSSLQTGQPVRLSKLMNTTLKGQSGDSLGQVQDIVVNPTSGQIQFVVLSLNGNAAGAPGSSGSSTSGIGTRSTDPSVSSPRSAPSTIGSYGTVGGKLVAVPWRLMSRGSGDQYTATVDRTRLDSAPTFNSSSWPTMDSAWMQRVYSHFGVDAAGASTGSPGSSSGTGTGTGTGTGLGNPSTPGLPATPGTPDINAPNSGTSPSTTPPSGTGTGTGSSGTGTSGSGAGGK